MAFDDYASRFRYQVYDTGRRHVNWDNVLAHADRCNVEIRHPLHDLRISHFAMGADGQYFLRGDETKHLLRLAMRGTLPGKGPHAAGQGELHADHPWRAAAAASRARHRRASARADGLGRRPPSTGDVPGTCGVVGGRSRNPDAAIAFRRDLVRGCDGYVAGARLRRVARRVRPSGRGPSRGISRALLAELLAGERSISPGRARSARRQRGSPPPARGGRRRPARE